MSENHYQNYIAGEFVEGATRLQSENPATGESWASFSACSKAQVQDAVAAAKAALDDPEWRDMLPTQRGKLLYRLAELIEKHAQKLAELETMDSGKLLAETSAQTGYVADYYRYFAGLADKIEGAVLPIDKPDMHVFTRPEPIGVVVAVVPWNAQMFLSATKLGPALAAGCTVILKASEIAPIPMLEFAKILDEVGFPKGVISVVTGTAEDCAIPLTSHPDVDRIAFTGGPETARHVVQNSANNFAVTTLELGGKSPILVFDDADLDAAANGLIAGNFGASGQSCVAGSRGLISRNLMQALTEKIKEKVAGLRIGDPLSPDTHIGPLCTKAQVECAAETLQKAKAAGAHIVFGGNAREGAGNYFEPTLVHCPSDQIATLKQEMFAPVMSMLPFDTEEEAIALANNSDFGLGSGIFTENLARAHRVSRRLRSGICWINTYRAISPIAPFGGFNRSGYGREAGLQSVLDYTRTKTVWVNTSDAPMSNPFTMR